MLKLKQEYKAFAEENKQEIIDCDDMFTNDNSYYLENRLPVQWKKRVDKLWYASPLAHIQDGWHNEAMMHYELDDLRQDNICKGNLNKEYWLKAYMLRWLLDMPEIATAEYLMANIDRRKSWITLIKNAYSEVK